MTRIDWENITNYIDSVGTTDTVFPFIKAQSSVKVTTSGANDNIIYTIGGQSGTLSPGQSVTVTGSISSMTLRSASGRQPFQVWATEAGTEKDETDTSYQGQIDGLTSQLSQKASQASLDATNSTVALKADKSEVTNVMTPKGNIAYASLPTTGNTIGNYYYCSDGDGTHGTGNYVWNGTSWFFGGTGDQGYNMVNTGLNKLDDYTSNLIGNVFEENLYKGSAGWTGTWISGATTWQDASETLNGFKVKTKYGTWSGLFKLINVVAGKTYTFMAWAKVSVAQNISVKLNQNLSGYVTTATVTGDGTQFSLSANTWTKITLTFQCTVSGTIAPRLENPTLADLYIAKYRLVEGNSPFELSNVVNDVNNIKSLDVQGIKTDVANIATPFINILDNTNVTKNYVYNRGTQTAAANTGCDIYDLINIKAGTTYYYKKIYAYFTTIKYADNTKVSLSNTTGDGESGSFTATQDGTIAISINHTQVSGYLFTTSQDMYNSNDVSTRYMPNKLLIPGASKVYHVEKDGSGDFTKLTDAITEACKYMDSTVYVGAGTWDLIAELGDTYINSVSSSQRGLYLKNRVHVIFSSNSLVTCNYTGSNTNTINWLSPFNAGVFGFTLENARIISSNCRYSMHDERDSDSDQYKNHYINCSMKHNGGLSTCLGGGLGLNGHIIVEGCTFENPVISNIPIVSWHNSAGIGRSLVEVKDCYFKGTNGLRFSWYGQSTDISTMLAHGNSFGRAIEHRAETSDGSSPNANTELIEWNNIVRP